MPLLDDDEGKWRVKRLALSKGDLGVEETIDQMRLLVAEAPKFPRLLALALAIVKGTYPLDTMERYRRLLDWSKRRIMYVYDQPRLEELTGVGMMLERLDKFGSIAGDCDCVAIFHAALAKALSLRVRWVTIATGRRGTAFTHVLTEVFAGGAWRSLDVFAPRAPRIRVRYWSV